MEKELQIVTLEQAKILKELGFDWMKTDDEFSENKLYAYHERTQEYRAVTVNFLNTNGNCVQYAYVSVPTYDAPTIQLASKWLRDTKGIYLIVQPLWNRDEIPKLEKYRWWFMPDFVELTNEEDDLEYETFNEAESAGLDFILKHITTKK